MLAVCFSAQRAFGDSFDDALFCMAASLCITVMKQAENAPSMRLSSKSVRAE